MKKNMGNIDKVIRVLFAIVVAVLYLTNVITGVLAIILLVLSVIFILTSIFGICPIYSILGLSSKKKEE